MAAGSKTSSKIWHPLDISRPVRAWTQDRDSNQVRLINTAAPVRRLASAINHLLGQHMPHIASQVQSADTASGEGAQPVLTWKADNSFDNARKRTFRALVMFPAGGTGTSYIQRSSASSGTLDSATVSTGRVLPAPTATFPEDLVEVTMTHSRGAASGTVDEEGLTTFPAAATSVSVYDLGGRRVATSPASSSAASTGTTGNSATTPGTSTTATGAAATTLT